MNASGPTERTAQPLPGATSRDAPATTATTHRLEYIDGLRALAALWVVVHHTIETSEPTRLLKLPIVGPVLASLFMGQFPVMVFLMLSGFCLYYPYVRKNPTRPEFNTGYVPFLIRRAKRLAPPYLWAGLFCLGMAAIPQLQVGRWKSVGPIDGSVILSHLLFVHNLIPSHATKIDYPMWSIGLEWQLYLLFPLMMWGFRRSNGPTVIGVTLVVAAVIRATYRHVPEALGAILHDGPFSYLEIFCMGMFAASLTIQGRRIAPKWLLASVAVLGMVAVRLGSGNGLAHDLETTAAAFCVLLLAADPHGVVSRVLSRPRLVQMGIFSYSIYLVHAPLIHLSWLALTPLHLSPEVTFVVLVAVALPAIIFVSYGFHCLFERPFMRTQQIRPIVASPNASVGG
jgi:peptidoglycan/LPS O-acetylase OafA/YrhL